MHYPSFDMTLDNDFPKVVPETEKDDLKEYFVLQILLVFHMFSRWQLSFLFWGHKLESCSFVFWCSRTLNTTTIKKSLLSGQRFSLFYSENVIFSGELLLGTDKHFEQPDSDSGALSLPLTLRLINNPLFPLNSCCLALMTDTNSSVYSLSKNIGKCAPSWWHNSEAEFQDWKYFLIFKILLSGDIFPENFPSQLCTKRENLVFVSSNGLKYGRSIANNPVLCGW